MIGLLLLTVGAWTQPQEPVLRVRALPGQGREVVARLPADYAAKLPKGRWKQEFGESVLTVALIDPDTKKTGPSMLGKYERTDNELVFTPRFPFDAGQTYRIDYHHPKKLTTLDYRMPPPAPKSPPQVVKIYPTADVLPANHLKFYIYFDRPMRGGKEIFDQIVLVDDKGKVIDDPWLLDEIWDEENNCLIIYIHPGRIKWGVLLREQLGPVLYEKRQYSLVIRGEMTDPDGNKIGKDIVKKFRTTPEDRTRLELSQWKVSSACAGTRERLIVEFPKSIDHRGLQKYLSVLDDKGQRVEGDIEIGQHEKSWALLPKHNWKVRTYYLEVKGDLEDVAGNNPLRPFDRDLKTPKLPPQKLRLEFRPAGD
ncbi:MAG: hypothetical protein HY289_10215 [Planctomycetes bacterium]|nr:hypothetical protein [Planctomycetota bacterium]